MSRYNLLYNKDADIEALKSQLISLGAEIVKELTSLNVIVIDAPNTDFAAVADVISHEEDSSVTPISSAEWHQLRIASRNLPMREHYIPQNNGESATVYLVDSGVDATHSELVDANIVNLHSFDGTFTDTIGHGTGIASMIVGKTLGISTGATLKSVKIPLNDTTSLSVLLEAFNAIAADQTDPIAVINCSWHIPKSQILDTKIIEMQDLGFVVVAAAGNTVSDADNLSPVGLNSVIGVGASDSFDRVVTWSDSGAGSNWGEEVDLFAPGIDVSVATLNNQIVNNSGTSIAAGIVSGIVVQFVTAKEDFKAQLNVETITAANIQELVLENAEADVLFRDETIYGTTPNKLIMGLTRNTFFTNAVPESVVLAPSESYTLHFDVDANFVGSINIDNVQFGSNTFHHADWITLAPGTFDVVISPPEGTENKKHRLIIEFLDSEGNRLSIFSFKVIVSDTGDALDEAETYKTTIGEDGEVYVTAADCTSGCATVCFDPPPFKGTSCSCSFNACITQF